LGPSLHTSLIGATIGNYRVVAKLGEGGMGAVYLAEHPLIGKKVAIKIVREDSTDVAERFFNEARLVNDIGHAHIVDVVDYGVVEKPSGRFVYLIMEFLAGEPLSALLAREGPLAPGRAVAVALQIADALAACHDKGVVHRDLKPDNVFLVRDDFVKVLDFGIAKLASARPNTDRGMVVGTPAYMAPEQCEGRRDVDARADVYALGVLCYEMLGGVVPFSGEGYRDVLNQHLTRTPPPLDVVPGPLAAVVLRALEKRREARFRSMLVFGQALADPQAYLAGALPEAKPYVTPALPLPPPVTGVTQHPTTLTQSAAEVGLPPRPGARVGVMLASGLLALALLGGGAWWLYRRASAPIDKGVDDGVVAARTPEAPPPVVEAVAPATVSLSVTSDPPGAEVLVDGTPRGPTPIVLDVPKSDGELAIGFRLAGHKDKTRAVKAARDAAIDVTLEKIAPPPRKAVARDASSPPRKPVKPLDDDAVLQPNF
jgi:serine/threonine-protein kinase